MSLLIRIIIKIVLTFVVIFISTWVLSLIRDAMGTTVSTRGIGPIVIYPATMAGIYAIWAWNPDKKKGNSIDNESLKKD